MSDGAPLLAIVSVGDELLAGDIVDSNAAEIAREFRTIGVRMTSVRVVGDEVERIGRAVADAANEARFVVVTGGLGPTRDDLTRDGLARAAGTDLVEDAAALAAIEALFAKLGRTMSPSNRLQALRPRTASCIANPVGTAPGIDLPLGAARVFALPGVPSEMRRLLADHVLPVAASLSGRSPGFRVRLHAHGLPESIVGERIAEFMGENRDPQVGVTVSRGILTVTLTDRGRTADGIDRTRSLADEIERRLAPHGFGRDGVTLEEAVIAAARARGRTIATAESCTGGRIAALITRVAGASDVFVESAVCYANAAKIARLGVRLATLERFGAVSAEVATEMVDGIARNSGSASVSVTGIAGPGGGSADKPVGLVFIGVRVGDAAEAHRFQFIGDRESIQTRATSAALDLLRKALLASAPRV